jgi:hypothetical protein
LLEGKRKKRLECLRRNAEQINGREGETATFLSTGLFILCLSLAVSPHVISTVGHLPLKLYGFSKFTFNSVNYTWCLRTFSFSSFA